MPQQKTQNSLQQRVDKYLSGKPRAYVVEEAGEEAVEDIFNIVQKSSVECVGLIGDFFRRPIR